MPRKKAPPKIRSWFAEYWTTDGKTMIGGVYRSRSCRWGHEEDARTSLETTLEVNRGAGVQITGKVVPSKLPPEIFRHCHPSIAQGINGRCFGCGKILTEEDARKHVAVPLENTDATA